ncbi:glycosyltransferase family 9 protein [Telluria mixta]|uniref:Glycosyltransferase family 9 protein n=1 Tax=Telluria mixta TaxID=34071 RepID=A0ABT2C944_9BURK|nr:glycosyltransferase family 9 protein [Telluria mixta]MCS0633662.1 glycosyltransferase family 9 protein [Telluria mixta]WEM98082.1 glycosyltransferase family 9 protein [Telluria mixta]
MYRRPLLQRLDPPSVIVFRALHLGDMLCAVPALRALRAAAPGAHIALVGLPWAQQFAERFSAYIDEFIAFPGHPLLPEQPVRQEALAHFYNSLCTRRFALALQLHGSGDVSNDIVSGFGAQAMAGFCRGAPVVRDRTVLFPYPDIGAEPERLLSLMEQLGAPSTGVHLEFPLSRDDEDEWRASGLGTKLEHGGYLCIHPGARKRDKCWPAASFAEVGDRLAAEFGLKVVLTGSAEEADLTADVAARMHHTPLDAAAPISIGAMAVLMRGARLLLCNDTGVSHIAAGLRLKSVVVFSKADIARWAPLDRHTHRCIWDPGAERAQVVLQHARALLAGTAPSRQRSVGMWPYW